jgi:3,4-dihydroxy 2-butanone 4-phosphate synthase/GTP cyclohydrolase II
MEIIERVPIQVKSNVMNIRYLKTKKEKMGHMLSFNEETPHNA